MDGIDSFITKDTEGSFEEAVRYFGEKIPVTVEEFYKISGEYQSLAFTISGYTKIQILKKFQEVLLKAISEGETVKTFRDQMNVFLDQQGYEGLTPFQADNIFRTNVQTAFQVGHYEQMTAPGVLKLRPYWQYDAVNDRHTRPSHLAMDGRVFPADSPVWDTWFPPNGFRCRCTVRTLSKRQVEEQGLQVEDKVPGQAQLQDGRFTQIMPDANFGSNPAKQRFRPDLEGYPEPLVNAYRKAQKQDGEG